MIVEVDNIFKMEGFNVIVMVDIFWVNDDDWGVLCLDVNVVGFKSWFEGYLVIIKDILQFIVEGFFNLEDICWVCRGGDSEKV